METLTALFGSATKVKLLRLFLFNQGTPFLLSELAERTRTLPRLVKKELNPLIKTGVIKSRTISKEINLKRGKKIKGVGYLFNDSFPYTEPLKNFLTIASLQADETLIKRFTNAGKIKLFIAAGVFAQNWDSRVDLLIVGDELSLEKIEAGIKIIESEIGKEIAYSAFDTQDFEYRLGIHDRLIRDILDYTHVTLLDKLGIETK